ncbi:MAG TPA: hypothetical protein VMH39_09105, partial [Gemmatimonadaceae bacterium]|nr:hypothetical protein [Gemmatimonadaceae bacterium]
KRAVRLNVSGAFHSPLMEFARAGLAEALGRAAFADPRFPVYANVNARPVTTAAAARSTLLEQLVNPVQWSAEVSALAAAFPDALYLELGPGSVLAGLVKKIAPAIRVLPCATPAHVETVLERLAA